MAKLMFQFRQPGKVPSLDDVRANFGLQVHEIDPAFGVVETDSREGLYTVLVDEAARPQIEQQLKRTGADADPAVGLFSNPPIEPFGPPR
jgi:hypothetical protein